MVARRPALVATSNQGKLREILEVMSDLPVQWTTLADHPEWPAPVEDGDTFEANAAKKALYYAARSGLWTLADDSGLVVDVLGGAPGVQSARYAGEPSNTAANNAKLVAALQGVPAERRSARFYCAVTLACGEGILATASGTIEGRIIDTPRGTNGFGFDPHFWVDAFGMTTAEMAPQQKNRVSHRGKALAALRPKLIALLPQS
jgi:XTP/dITP diphosphohydrolase